nr:PAS domain S-box protein [Bacteroidota bacterium]
MEKDSTLREMKELMVTLMENKVKYRDLYYLMRSVGDNIPDMIWAKDLDCNYILVNKAICKNLLNAKTPIEPIGKNDMYFAERERASYPNNPDWHTFGEICVDSDEVVMKSGKPEQFDEYGYVKGEFLFLDVHKAPLFDHKGRIIGTVGSARDVTMGREIQHKLIESEEKYRRLYERSSDPILIIEDGIFVDCNDAILDFLRISSKSYIIGKRPHEISPEFQPDALTSETKAEQLIRETIRDGYKRFEWVHLDGNNQKIWVDVALTLFPQNGIDRIFTIWRDITKSKQHEKLLKENEERYRVLFESASDAIFLMKQNIFIDCNQRTYEMFGCTTDEIIGKTPYLFSPKKQPNGSDSEALAKTKIADTLYNGSNFFEWRHCKLDGSEFDVEVSLNKITIKGEDFIQAIVRDITGRKKIEEKTNEHLKELSFLSESAMQLLSLGPDDNVYDFIGNEIANLVHNCIILVLTYDKKTKLMEVQNITGIGNTLEKVLNLLGQNPIGMQFKVSDTGLSILKKQKLVKGPQTFYELSNFKLNKNIALALEKLIRLHEIYIMGMLQNDVFLGEIAVFVRKDGSIGNKNLLETFINQSAIALQKREIEESLRESEEKYRSVVNNSSEGIFIVQNEFCTYANPRVLEATGFSSEEFLRQMISGMIYHEDSEKVMNTYFTPSNGDSFPAFDFRIIRKDQSIIWVNIHATKIQWNEQPAVLCFLTDINHKKQAEQELLKKNEELVIAKEKAEESDRLKTTFLATMSHELRTPLNSIIGFSDFIDETLEIDQITDFARTIQKNGVHLLNLIEDMFDISMIESGNVKINKSYFNLREFITEVNQLIREEQKIQHKEHLKVLTDYDFEIIDENVLTDKPKLKQVYINLIRNAVKFTEQGKIQFGFYIDEQNDLVFFIKDTGIGIADEKLSLVFERFRQAEDSHTRKYGGTGLGLYICSLLIQKLNGKIWVKSQPGHGSAFYFSIPGLMQKPELITPAVQKPRLTDYDFSGKTILIAEDEDSNLMLIDSILRKTGADTIHATDGLEVVEKSKVYQDVDLILMDIKMPKLNGLEATQKIRALNITTIIIALTAYALKGDREKAIAAGCNDYISKPINKIDLLEILAVYLKDA